MILRVSITLYTLIVGASIGLSSCTAPRSGLSEADEAFVTALAQAESSDYSTAASALAVLRPLAEQGNSLAEASLGHMYENGRGVARDEKEAMKWYGLAAVQGNRLARERLSELCDVVRGVGPPDAEHWECTRVLAGLGDAFAQVMIGQAYLVGQGVPQNDSEAFRWNRLAAAQGQPAAQVGVASAFESGTPDMPPDRVRALMWYTLARTTFSPDIVDIFIKDLTAKMTAAEITDAESLARKCKASGFQNCD